MPDSQGIHQVFESQAARAPDRPALKFGAQRVSYGELNLRANRLAHYLRAQGVGPNVFVGLYLERSIDLVVGLVGILKAGGTYVPIDPQYPSARLAFMMKDSSCPVILTQRTLAAGLTLPDTKIISLDGDAAEIAREPATNPDVPIQPDDLAYVIYTCLLYTSPSPRD